MHVARYAYTQMSLVNKLSRNCVNMDDEQLIEAVRNHSALYDLTPAAYRNVDCKEKA
jgi:hypothetical protein